MKYLIIHFILFVFAKSVAQTIPFFKSNDDCLKFIKNKEESMKDFYFDSLFSKAELKNLTPPFKSWQRMDLNNDNKPDLILVGAFKNAKYEPNVAMAYISNGDTYNLLSITREGTTSFRPHVFTQRENGQTRIIVHNYYFRGLDKVEDLLKNGKLMRTFCIGDDTLFYKFSSIIDFSTHPSGVTFDSLILVKQYGWSSNADSFVLYKNGSGCYFGGDRNYHFPIIPFEETKSRMAQFRYLIKSINLERTQRLLMQSQTDLGSATLSIYHDGKVEVFSNYGMRKQSFTIKEIYKYFEELKPKS